MKLLERIIQNNQERKQLQTELAKASEYYDLPFNEMFEYYHLMKPKQAEKFIEGWVANLFGGEKIDNREVPEEHKKKDVGDIKTSGKLDVGRNNIELKSSINADTGIGGGQLRFYEPVPYYLFFKAWNNEKYEMFLLTKQQLIDEIKSRARTTGKSAFVSSQGSGDISRLNNEQKLKRLDENVQGKKLDKIGWGFNPKTEPEYYEHFKKHYQVTPDQINKIINDAV